MFAAKAAAQRSRPNVSAAEVNGTYKMNFQGKFKKFSNEVKTLALGRGKIRFALDLVFPYSLRNGEDMVNMGGLDAEAPISGDTAVYESKDKRCKLTIRFVKPGTVKIDQDGSDGQCGFGHNVMATGTYKKVSSKKPRI
jgi:carotenoid cleavage dioxygenase-like enzyme